MSIKNWLEKNTDDLKGNVIAITGGTGGLGVQIVKILVGLNASIILLDRNIDKGNRLIEELKKIREDVEVSQIPIDLSNYKSVREGVERLKKVDKIDALILNAGVYHVKRNEEDKNYLEEFRTNFISPFYIALNLVDKIKTSNLKKVVDVGSISYKLAKLNEEDIDYSKETKQMKIYGNSKRMLMCALIELFKNNSDISFSLTHPGVTPTNITRNFPKIVKGIIKLPMKIVFNSPKRASLSIIKGLFDETKLGEEWIGPKHFDIWGMPQKKKLNGINREECQKAYNLGIKLSELIDKS